jgi:hypothetical protein
MSVFLWFGDATFAGTHGNGRAAPIPAVRLTTIELLNPSLTRHSGLRRRTVGTAESRSVKSRPHQRARKSATNNPRFHTAWTHTGRAATVS